MGDDGVGVAGQEILAGADADDEGRSAPRPDDDAGFVAAMTANAISANDFAQGVADGLGERVGGLARWASGAGAS